MDSEAIFDAPAFLSDRAPYYPRTHRGPMI